jgi:hypothetical protein
MAAEPNIVTLPGALPAEPPARRERSQTRRRHDPTNAERQRRHRKKQEPATAQNNVTPTAAAAVPDAAVPRLSWSVWPLAGTTVGLMAVSLTHLSDGVMQLAAIPVWQSWAMAIGIDCMLISVALAQLTAPPDVKKDIATVAHCMEGGTLVMSAGLNALAFTGGAFDAAHWAQIAFGCFVPAAISGATYILARLTRR